MSNRKVPPRKATDEASREGLRLAKEAGDAYRRMVEYFVANVASSGSTRRAGDFVVGFAVEEAEPLWHACAGKLELKEPPRNANAHLEVVVMDGADGRFIPELTVTATLTDASGGEIGTWDLPFLWHPTMYHYGRSVLVPGSGKYDATVTVEMPLFPRHDKVNGNRYAGPVRVVFTGIELESGRKS